MTPKWDPKSDTILGEMLIGAPLVVQTVFVMKKLAPNVAKVLPRLEKWAKNDTKELPEYENELQKSTLFGAKRKCAPKVDPLESRPGGLREALTITSQNILFFQACFQVILLSI